MNNLSNAVEGPAKETPSINTAYNYKDKDGNTIYIIQYNYNKSCLTTRVIDEKTVHGLKKGNYGSYDDSNYFIAKLDSNYTNKKHFDKQEIVIYNLDKVIDAINSDTPVLLAESEEVCDRLAKLGYVATTSPYGINKMQNSLLKHFKDATCYIVSYNDSIKKEDNDKIINSLQKYAKSIKLLNIPSKRNTDGSDIIDIRTFLSMENSNETLESVIMESKELKLPPLKLSITQKNGRYVKTVVRKDGIEEVTISNFIITPIEMITDSSGQSLMTIQCTTIEGDKHILSIKTKEFTYASTFKKILNTRNIDFLFKATDTDLEEIKRLMNEIDYPRRNGVKAVGMHKSGDEWLFVTKNKTINSDNAIVNDLVFMPDGEEIKTSILDNDFITKNELEQIANPLFAFNDLSKTLPVLGFCAGSFLKEKLNQAKIKFNLLILTGQSGSGKSTTLTSVIAPIFSLESPATDADSVTTFTVSKTCSSSNVIPLIIDEYKPGFMSLESKKQVSTLARSSYEGNVIKRGTQEQSINHYTLTAPIIICGEAGFEEKAVIERSIEVVFSKEYFTDERKDNLICLRQNEKLLNKFGRSILDIAMKMDETEIKELHNQYTSDLKNQPFSDRVANSLANCRLGLFIIEKLFDNLGVELPVDASEFSNLLASTILDEMLGGSGETKGVVDKTIEHIDTVSKELIEGTDYIIKEDELCLVIKEIYPKLTKFIKNHYIQTETLSKEQFMKQVKKTPYYKDYNNRTFNNGFKRKCLILDLNILHEKLELSAFQF